MTEPDHVEMPRNCGDFLPPIYGLGVYSVHTRRLESVPMDPMKGENMEGAGNYIQEMREALKARISDFDKWGEDAEGLLDLYALLAISKGQQTTMEDIHDAWSLWTNRSRPDHKSLVPFSLLGVEIAEYDRPYMAAVHEVGALLRQAHDRALEWCREDAAIHRLNHDQASFEDTRRRVFERLAKESA